MNIQDIILTSTLAGAIAGGAISWVSNRNLQQTAFLNEYYKQLIAKRLKAYETVEALNKYLMQAVAMTDGRSYPIMFHSSEKFVEAMVFHAKASEEAVWLSHDITDILGTFNHLVILANEKYRLEGAAPELYRHAGTEMYNQIIEVRHDLHYQLRNDFKDLHKIESFIRA